MRKRLLLLFVFFGLLGNCSAMTAGEKIQSGYSPSRAGGMKYFILRDPWICQRLKFSLVPSVHNFRLPRP